MKTLFTIKGNHEDRTGNPIPYVRSTRAALWRADGRRYAAWKGYVQKEFIQNLKRGFQEVVEGGNLAATFDVNSQKPIRIFGDHRARMDIRIFWKNGAHGDPDNIFKGIADALFFNDRNLDGSFESGIADDGVGRVEVNIKIG